MVYIKAIIEDLSPLLHVYYPEIPMLGEIEAVAREVIVFEASQKIPDRYAWGGSAEFTEGIRHSVSLTPVSGNLVGLLFMDTQNYNV